jgi:hypothetical protein
MTNVVILNRVLRTFYPAAVFLLMFCILAWSAVGQGERPVDVQFPKFNQFLLGPPLSSSASCGEVRLGIPQENSCRVAN